MTKETREGSSELGEEAKQAIQILADSGIPVDVIVREIEEKRQGASLETREILLTEGELTEVAAAFFQIVRSYVDGAGRRSGYDLQNTPEIIRPVLELIVQAARDGRDDQEIIQMVYDWCNTHTQLNAEYKRKVVKGPFQAFISKKLASR